MNRDAEVELIKVQLDEYLPEACRECPLAYAEAYIAAEQVVSGSAELGHAKKYIQDIGKKCVESEVEDPDCAW